MDYRQSRGTSVRFSICGSGWQWRRKRWKRRSGQQRGGRTQWSGRQRGRHVRGPHEQQGNQQYQRLQFSRPGCRPCPRGRSIGHARGPRRRANEPSKSSRGSHRSCACARPCAGEHEAPQQLAHCNQPFDLMKHRGRLRAPSVFHFLLVSNSPFLLVPADRSRCQDHLVARLAARQPCLANQAHRARSRSTERPLPSEDRRSFSLSSPRKSLRPSFFIA